MTHLVKTYEETLELSSPLYIDLRSEGEYQEDHLPEAVNLPLLNNEERKVVGTVYKQESHEKAKELGIQYVSQKLPQLFRQIQDYMKVHELVFYCKGGGYRSTSLVALLHGLGEHVYQLEGGYKAYRHHLLEDLDQLVHHFEFVNLTGYTGCGKTEILKELDELGAQTLDLEGFANHRGSSFGGIGKGQQPSQKAFENMIYQELLTMESGYIFIESESNLIGRLYVPDGLRRAYKQSSHQVAVTAPLEDRVLRIYEDYIHQDNDHLNEDIHHALKSIKKYIGDQQVHSIQLDLGEGRYQQVIEKLMTKYYDSHYLIKTDDFELTIDNQDSKESALKLLDFYEDKL